MTCYRDNSFDSKSEEFFFCADARHVQHWYLKALPRKLSASRLRGIKLWSSYTLFLKDHLRQWYNS